MKDLQYPIGKFSIDKFPDRKERQILIKSISLLPAKLNSVVSKMSEKQLNQPYREGGWTARQVIHHLPDSHMNAYIRFKLALTEDIPVIRPYDQDGWAKLPDYKLTPVEMSVSLLSLIHKRWVILLKTMNENDFKRKYLHPESGEMTLAEVLAHYDWHGRHHLAQIKSVK